jgi:hypothetical protein
MDSVIMTGNLATIQSSEIDRILGTFSGLRELDAALRTTLALQLKRATNQFLATTVTGVPRK